MEPLDNDAASPLEIGFLGLGGLGQPVARNLIEAGHRLAVYNRDGRKADALVELGARRSERPADAVTPGGVVFSLLWDDASVEDVVRSEGFLLRLGEGGVHVSMSTLSPGASARLSGLHAEHGSTLVEAPIFGRPEAAVAKKLWIVTAGPQASKERVRPLLQAARAQGVFDYGTEPGRALAVKLIGNLLIVSATASLAEGLSLARSMDIDVRSVVEMLTATLFPAPIYQAYGKMLVNDQTVFESSSIPRKDIGLFMAEVENGNRPPAISRALLTLLTSASQQGAANRGV